MQGSQRLVVHLIRKQRLMMKGIFEGQAVVKLSTGATFAKRVEHDSARLWLGANQLHELCDRQSTPFGNPGPPLDAVM